MNTHLISKLQNKSKKVTKDLNPYEKKLGRIGMKQQIQYQKYRGSLKPISMGEFVTRLAELAERYNNIIKNSQKLNIVKMSVDINFDDIMPCDTYQKDAVDLAEIIDKTEKRIIFIETLFAKVNKLDLKLIAKERKGR